jgi:hypothetical protein
VASSRVNFAFTFICVCVCVYIYIYVFMHFTLSFNPLNAKLNPICHLLVLLGDLTFMGLCIVSTFQYISNKMQRYTVYLYLETALHVSSRTSTHHECIQLYLQHLVFVTPVTAICRYHGRTGTGLSVLWVAWELPLRLDYGRHHMRK